jgi:2-polyprenyl-6-methoxyphenol hydroxylase-like FAD-dependent oxidoreductase
MRKPVGVPVLIVGGGPVGLLMAVGLRHFGVDCMVAEKHASTLDFPKGRRVTARTVEIFRQWGLEAAVSGVSLPQADSLFVFDGETLLGADFQRRGLPVDEVRPSSPTRELICSQELLESVLRERAQDGGADVRFSTEVAGFTQDDDGVTAEIVGPGEPVSVRATYMVAADGVRGRAREALGVSRSGPGAFGYRVSILVEADIEIRMKERQSAIYWLRQPLPGSLFAAVDNKSRWLFAVPYDPDTEPAESLTEDRCIELVRGGLGDDSVELHYIGHRVWEPTALVADRYQIGRVFLAGDAAHITMPVGGLGMNCGVADAHNLAWKLPASSPAGPAPRCSRATNQSAARTRSPAPARAWAPRDRRIRSTGSCWGTSASLLSSQPITLPRRAPETRSASTCRWEGRVIGPRICGSAAGARPSTCTATSSSRSLTRRANERSMPPPVLHAPPELRSSSTSSAPLPGTTCMESNGAASCSSALTDTSRGGASGHLRRHTRSQQRYELPPATAPAATNPKRDE